MQVNWSSVSSQNILISRFLFVNRRNFTCKISCCDWDQEILFLYVDNCHKGHSYIEGALYYKWVVQNSWEWHLSSVKWRHYQSVTRSVDEVCGNARKVSLHVRRFSEMLILKKTEFLACSCIRMFYHVTFFVLSCLTFDLRVCLKIELIFLSTIWKELFWESIMFSSLLKTILR